jgi:hypothetical protein
MKYPITVTAHLEVVNNEVCRFKRYALIQHEPSGTIYPTSELPANIREFFCEYEDISREFVDSEFGTTEFPGDPTIRVLTQRLGPDAQVAKRGVYCDDIGDESVDLKWSCWSTCEGHWEDYAPGVYARIRDLKPLQEITIRSFPRKEIRGMEVTIKRVFPSMWTATGAVWASWDEPNELMDTVGLLDEDYEEAKEFLERAGGDYLKANELAIQAGYSGITNFDAFNESVPYSRHASEPGVDWDIDVKANTFAKLMRKIDRCEDRLITASNEEWRLFENMFNPDKER